ncbi:MAG: DUF6473 family protein [Paracoccaceae bacterium]|nr:DUF6473 family protein [Paracoccaceae bacterium]
MLDAYSRGGLDYHLCRYGTSRLLFRGPAAETEGRYLAALGGSATFGKFVVQPWPVLLERITGAQVVNLGCMHAGATAFADDRSLITICNRAQAAILHITGAHCLDNSYYTLHPRRNDRFIDATPKLRALYPEIDFTEFHFVRHMLSALHARSGDRFGDVVQVLKREWVERMRDLLRAIEAPVILLWMADRAPETPNAPIADQLRSDEPLFVDRDMIEAVRREAADFVMATATDDARREGLRGKVYADFERPAAMRMPGPLWHAEAATALYDAVSLHLPARPRRRTAPPADAVRASRRVQGRP